MGLSPLQAWGLSKGRDVSVSPLYLRAQHPMYYLSHYSSTAVHLLFCSWWAGTKFYLCLHFSSYGALFITCWVINWWDIHSSIGLWFICSGKTGQSRKNWTEFSGQVYMRGMTLSKLFLILWASFIKENKIFQFQGDVTLNETIQINTPSVFLCLL